MMVLSKYKNPKIRVLLILVFGLSAAIGLSVVSRGRLDSNQPQNWQGVSKIDAELLQQVVKENYFESAENHPFTRMTFLKIQPSKQSSPLFIFDFNEPQLCGKGGCLFAGYIRDLDTAAYKQVLRVLLPKPFGTSPRISLIESRKHQSINCLNVSLSVRQESETFQNLSYCYNGNNFVQVNREYVIQTIEDES